MIKTVNDLLVVIKDKGIKEIEPFLNTIKHGPSIGDMYEGLTKEIASKALFECTDIRVASGFITNSDGDISKQIDCMIVAGENSIVKTSGMPYGLVVNEVDSHCWLASYRRNPLILFLELLWTRLSYRYDLPSDVFGCDVQLEGLAPFAFVTGTKTGWVYQFYPLDEEGLKHYDKDKAWEPVVLEQNEFILMNLLCEGKEVKVSELCRYVNGNAEDIIRSLNKKRLVYVDDRKDSIDDTLYS